MSANIDPSNGFFSALWTSLYKGIGRANVALENIDKIPAANIPDASKRALAWIESRGIVTRQEHDMAKDALKWAAMTYVVAAIGALTTLFYYVMMFLGANRDE